MFGCWAQTGGQYDVLLKSIAGESTFVLSTIEKTDDLSSLSTLN